jgi:type IV pilus assembly protein PilF
MKQIQHIMDIYLVEKRAIFAALALLPVLLTGCVTQNYENDKTPVVQNQANRDDMAATRVSLGLGYLKMGNMPQAKQNLEKAKNFAPDMVQVYTAFAHYYETVGEHQQTVESYEKALTIKSDDADTLNNYGVYLCRQDQIDEAEKQLLKAIAVPSYILVAKSYENLSSCFLQKDDFVKAEVYLNKAVLHSPSSSSTIFQMVRLQYAMGDYKQAKSFEQRFEKVTRRFTPQSLALAYKVHFKLGQRKTAKNYGAMLVKMYPQSWEAQQYILNELELIEADNLAKRYQLSQADNTQTKVKKRIVKLSPKKVSAEKLTPELAVKSPKPIVPAVIFEKETSKVNLSVSQESPTVIVNNEAEKKTIIKTHTKENHQDKRVVVLELDKTKQEKITKENSVILLAKNEESKTVETKTEVIKEEPRPIKKEKVQNFPDFHVVNKGDTLYNISVKYNIKIKALRKWNKISKNKKLHIKDIIFLENPKSVNQ